MFSSLTFVRLNIINPICHHLGGNITFQAGMYLWHSIQCSGSNSLNMKADIRYLVVPPGPSAGTILRHWVNISETMFEKREGGVRAGYRYDLGNCISWDWEKGNNPRKGVLVTRDMTQVFFSGRLRKCHLYSTKKRYTPWGCVCTKVDVDHKQTRSEVNGFGFGI